MTFGSFKASWELPGKGKLKISITLFLGTKSKNIWELKHQGLINAWGGWCCEHCFMMCGGIQVQVWILVHGHLCCNKRWVLPVWLEGDAVIARHLAEVLLQLSEELLVAISLIQRHEGVDVGKLPPGDWLKKERTAVSRREWNFPKPLHVKLEGSFMKKVAQLSEMV